MRHSPTRETESRRRAHEPASAALPLHSKNASAQRSNRPKAQVLLYASARRTVVRPSARSCAGVIDLEHHSPGRIGPGARPTRGPRPQCGRSGTREGDPGPPAGKGALEPELEGRLPRAPLPASEY